MILIRRIRGQSMRPALRVGQVALFAKRPAASGDIVLALAEQREVVKRVLSLKGGKAYLVGDNHDDSYDSRHYGPIAESAILGVMKFAFPIARPPRDVMQKYDLWLGRVVAGIVALLLAVQLFRIDTFLPMMQVIVPSGNVIAMLTLLAMFAALPFALRLPLSPAARVTSGVMMVVAPLSWLIMSAWVMVHRSPAGTLPLFGEFVAVPSTIAFILSVVWLTLALVCVRHFGVRNK